MTEEQQDLPLIIFFPGAKYPPIKPNPTVDDCMRAFRVSDYVTTFGVTFASWGFGFIRGRPARFALAGLMAGIGFTFGSMVAMQNCRGRLMGFRENVREQAKYGVYEGDWATALNWKRYN
jgi:NADH-ubiquinone oxidoreductase complex I, 21 kDa subunit